jgi:hypothetical protein
MSDTDLEWTSEHAGEQLAPERQPVYLLADSQLLFWKRQGRLLLEVAVDGLARNTPLRAAYIGASNGDRPEFYGVFEAAVDAIGITNRRSAETTAPSWSGPIWSSSRAAMYVSAGTRSRKPA